MNNLPYGVHPFDYDPPAYRVSDLEPVREPSDGPYSSLTEMETLKARIFAAQHALHLFPNHPTYKADLERAQKRYAEVANASL